MSKPPADDTIQEGASQPTPQPTAKDKKPPKLTLVQKRTVEPGKDKPVQPPAAADFHSKQIDLFHSFVCNGEDERATLSNTLDLWDPQQSRPRLSDQLDRLMGLRGQWAPWDRLMGLRGQAGPWDR